jgi:hypothetical protein
MTNRHTMRVMAMTLSLILGGGALQTAHSADATTGPVGIVESQNDPGVHYRSADTGPAAAPAPNRAYR